MRHTPRRFTPALIVFSLIFQLPPLPAFAGGGRRGVLRRDGHHRTGGHAQGQIEAQRGESTMKPFPYDEFYPVFMEEIKSIFSRFVERNRDKKPYIFALTVREWIIVERKMCVSSRN